ncbi:MAG: phenylacetate--CoA ligase [Rhodospirillales bacterium]|nr:phenylacetate--CoA ligase [Rhodospirillales bacterium]
MRGNSSGHMYQPELETMPRAQLKKLQLERLSNLLSYAYENVPFYKNQFDDAKISSSDLNHLEDLAKFPFTEKVHLRDAYPFGLFAVPREKLVRIHASSGTTGKSTVVGYTAGDIDTWSNLMARTLACSGVRPGDILHNAFGYGLFTGGLGTHYGATRLGCTVVPISGGDTEKQLLIMQDFGANVLCATPSYALNIAEYADKAGIDMSSIPLRVGFFGAEPWTTKIRDELQTRLGLTATDNYGLSEIMGPGVATECSHAQNGLHGWEDHFLYEIIDPDSGEPLPSGEQGELVITTLTKQALPMVRYRTRDITRLIDEPCTCGRTHVRLEKMTGRCDDMLIIRGVNVFPSQVEANLVGIEGLNPFFRLVVSRDGTLDSLAVEVEAAPGINKNEFENLAKIAQHQIKSMVGVSCSVLIKSPGYIPRVAGKAQRVLDLRNKG